MLLFLAPWRSFTTLLAFKAPKAVKRAEVGWSARLLSHSRHLFHSFALVVVTHCDLVWCSNHRDLDERNGCRTYVSFGLRKDGWEVTSYFSPEIFASEHGEVGLSQ